MADKRASPVHPSHQYTRRRLSFWIAGIDSDASVIRTIRQPILTTAGTRPIESVKLQTRKPERIVCVIDSEEKTNPFPDYGPCVEWLHNRRTAGLSGALNTAFDHLLRTEEDPESVIVSLLDDDDLWDSNYIKSVYGAFIQNPTADFGAASLQRCLG